MEKTEKILFYLCVWLLYIGITDSVCTEVSYLEAGGEGVLSCYWKPFFSVSWYTKEDYDAELSPLMYFNSEKHGLIDEYDVNENGSLVIRNVSFDHAQSYVVTVEIVENGREIEREVLVEVYVVPVPSYPVVNDYLYQQHVYMDVERGGELRCLMKGVYPNVNLTWTFVDPSQRDKINIRQGEMVSTQNEDKTFDVLVTSTYQVLDQYMQRITIQCEVADEIGKKLFESKTKLELLFSPVPFVAAYPIVNGEVEQQHLYLDNPRQGQLHCFKKSASSEARLAWEVVDERLAEKIVFQPVNGTVLSNNEDGTVDISLTTQYSVSDDSIKRITIQCRVTGPDADEDQSSTTVDLLFPSVYPVVNGHVNQKHVYLDVEREGHLTCLKENVDVGTRLVWEVLDTRMAEKITFQSRAVVLNNNDDTMNINQTFDYEVHDHSLERLTIECKVIEPDTDEHPYTTVVDLLFQNVYPVVNGHVNQNHVYLDVDREGHLTCMKENVDVGTRLVWVLAPDVRGKVNFESNAIMSINNDGTVNINQTFDYEVHDNSLERITIECKVIEPGTDEHPYTTTVELLFGSDPVISGCYHQGYSCSLEVGRKGELTCTVKNSHYLVDLKWTTLDGDKYLVFEEDRVRSQNNTNLFDVSITTPYTVIDESVTSVTIQCDAYKSHSDKVLATTQASLVIQTALNLNNKCVVILLLSSFFLGTALQLIVMLYCNRKMYKKLEANLQELKGCIANCNGHHNTKGPEKAESTDFPDSGNSGSLTSEQSGSEPSEKGPEKAESTDFPDSGNPGSLSTEQSGSEPSEKCGLMEDVEMSCIYSKQGSLDDKSGCSEVDPMV